MCTVMVVDSRPMTLNWIQECIVNSNIKTDEIILCQSDTEAFNYIFQKKIDIAITRLQKDNSFNVELVKAMKKNLIFSMILGYGVCKDFHFLCNAVNSGISRYIVDIFDKDKLESFLNEAYDKYCINSIKLKYIVKAGANSELAYSHKMLNEWVNGFSMAASEGIEKNIETYIDFISEIIDSQRLQHSKSMILELIIILNEKIAEGHVNSDYALLNSKEYYGLMKASATCELKNLFSNLIKKLASNIYILTSADDHKSLCIISAVKYIKSNYQKDISRDEVAAAVNLNPCYFSKLFKEQMNESFVCYLRRIRLEESKHYIENTDLSIKEICTKVGYFDSKYFSRLFFDYTGYTPCEYRKYIVKLMA